MYQKTVRPITFLRIHSTVKIEPGFKIQTDNSLVALKSKVKLYRRRIESISIYIAIEVVCRGENSSFFFTSPKTTEEGSFFGSFFFQAKGPQRPVLVWPIFVYWEVWGWRIRSLKQKKTIHRHTDAHTKANAFEGSEQKQQQPNTGFSEPQPQPQEPNGQGQDQHVAVRALNSTDTRHAHTM